RARWWCAHAPDGVVDGRIEITRLEQVDGPAPIEGAVGLVAPCSLPGSFLAHLDAGADRPSQLRSLSGKTARRLLSDTRSFAKARNRGDRHPRRFDRESVSALDRTRLPLLCAALPLLRAHRVLPWAQAEPPFLCEVDVPAFLAGLALPHIALAGTGRLAVEHRVQVLQALEEGVAGPVVHVTERNLAIASVDAWRSIVAAVATAWMLGNGPPAVAVDAPGWIPIPQRSAS
ncbi:MAG: hypothetical protein V3T86_13610, partial [Planctomycetota bacterium]